MKYTIKEITDALEIELANLKPVIHKDAVAKIRYRSLFAANEYLKVKGFPRSTLDKQALSLVPKYFQEANYDGLEWFSRYGDLGHLDTIFNLDFAIQCHGDDRSSATEEAFSIYIADAGDAISVNQYPSDELERTSNVF